MYDIGNMNIWKMAEPETDDFETFGNTDISELNLSVRSFNCLKRAGCSTVEQVIRMIGEDGHGLRKIRNLGSSSEAEILEKIEEQRKLCRSENRTDGKKVTLIRPAKKMWDMNIASFHLSSRALKDLRTCGIRQVKDLYLTNPDREPGWYAVRELFEKIPDARSLRGRCFSEYRSDREEKYYGNTL